MKCEETEELLSPYLDEELLQFKVQLVENHLRECASCKETLATYRKLRQEMKGLQFSEPDKAQLAANRPPIVIKVTRGTGWLLVIAFAVTMICFGAYEFVTEPAVDAFVKIVVLGFILGFVLLFISVLHERIIQGKTDKYKEVEK